MHVYVLGRKAEKWNCWVIWEFLKNWISWKVSECFPLMLTEMTCPPTVIENSFFRVSLPALVSGLFDVGLFHWWEVIPPVVLIFISLIVSCAYFSSVYFTWGEVSVPLLFPVFDWVFCFVEFHELPILDITPLVYCVRIFPSLCRFSFIDRNQSFCHNTETF